MGVKGSDDVGWFIYSRSSVGKVWLLGRWKLEPGPPAKWRAWSDERNPPTFGSGEKVNGAVGLRALPENDEPAVSVKALDRDVVLCELECL